MDMKKVTIVDNSGCNHELTQNMNIMEMSGRVMPRQDCQQDDDSEWDQQQEHHRWHEDEGEDPCECP
jgi:hypothetical protein